MGASIRAASSPAMRNSANAADLQLGGSVPASHNVSMRTRKGSRGVTLIELLFGLAVVAILAGTAAPGMRSTLRAAAVRSATFELLAGLQQARANAIVEAHPGLLCPIDAAGRCAAAGVPSPGWRAFVEWNGVTRPLAEHTLPDGVQLRATRSPIRFSPTALSASTSTLTICDARGVATPRAIVINQNGRARLDTQTDATCRT
jgi:type IV fimbrial biogenesis protein FimT